MNVKFDLKNGSVIIDSTVLNVDSKGNLLVPPGSLVAKKGPLPDGEIEWIVCGNLQALNASLSLVVRAQGRQITSTCLLFDEIVFFDESILESKIVERFKEKYQAPVLCSHPALGDVGSFEWGKVEFRYDPRLGDLSLCLYYSGSSDKLN